MNRIKRILTLVLIVVLTFSTACGLIREKEVDPDQNPLVTMDIRDWGKVKIELYPNEAPNTVNNFIELANSGFYDGLIFHRIIEGFMIQGGDPDGNGMGGPGYQIKGEMTNNNFDNKLLHEKGVISMARSPISFDTAGSQFFITVDEHTSLDGDYAVFGKVIEGMDVVIDISKVSTDQSDRPLEDIVIKSMSVDTFGNKYPKAKKIQ